jgi:hypothetical protein
MSNCDNSIFLFEQLNNPKNNLETCPDNVTRDMLLKELMCKDLEAINDDLINDKNMLWKLFYYNNRSSNSPFGFTFINDEIADPLQNRIPTTRSMKRATTTKRNANASKRMTTTKRVNVVNNENKVTTQPSKKERRGFFNLFGKKNTRRVQRGRMFGGNARYDANRNTYISLLNESTSDPEQNFDDFRPMWRFGKMGNAFHTLSKLKPVDGLPIYVHGTSLPLQDTFEYPKSLGGKQYCANTLFFYKYVKNISRIISLQGCGLNWNLISLPTNVKLPFRPSNCQDLDEKRNWDNISKSNDTQYDDTKSSILEYYWIDMTSGFFDTYESIVSLDYTNPQLKTIVHCYAGYGRTGVTLLTILCKYFYSSVNRKKDFNILFNKPPQAIKDKRKQSSMVCRVLMSILFNHLEIDTLSDDTFDLNEDCIREINTSIEKFDINAVTHEVFLGWASNTNSMTNQVSISLTALNMLITRLNYVIYFTAYVNNIRQVNLYQLYRVDTITPHLPFITSDNLFEFPLLNPIQVEVKPFTRSLNHPNTGIYFGIDTIQPQPDFTAPPQTIYDHSDDPIGDERRSSIQDIPTPDERQTTIQNLSTPTEKIFTSPFAKRQQARQQAIQQQNNVGELHDISF